MADPSPLEVVNTINASLPAFMRAHTTQERGFVAQVSCANLKSFRVLEKLVMIERNIPMR